MNDYRERIKSIVLEDAAIPEPIADFIEWCRQEYASYEGNSYEETLWTTDPRRIARMVYSAWYDYCCELGLINH